MGRSQSPERDRHHKEHKEKKKKDRDKDRSHKDRSHKDSKDKDRDRDRERERSNRHSSKRSPSASRSRSRSRSRSPKRHKHSHEAHRSKDRHRDRDRDREGSKEPPDGVSGGSRDKDRSSRREKSQEPSALPSLPSSAAAFAAAAGVTVPPPVPGAGLGSPAGAAGGLSAEDAAAARRAAEAAELDAEVERRRKRVEEWRAKRAAEQKAAEEEEAAKSKAAGGAGDVVMEDGEGAGGAGAEGAGTAGSEGEGGEGAGAEAEGGEGPKRPSSGKGWSLEDDDEDDGHHQQGGGEEEEDTLDAFMRGNAPPPIRRHLSEEQEEERQERLAQQAGGGKPGAGGMDEDEDEDPLDAFMAAAVLPQVVSEVPGPSSQQQEGSPGPDGQQAPQQEGEDGMAVEGPTAGARAAAPAHPRLAAIKREEDGMDVDGDSSARQGSESFWPPSESKAGYGDDSATGAAGSAGARQQQANGTASVGGPAKSEAGGVKSEVKSEGGTAEGPRTGPMQGISSRGFLPAGRASLLRAGANMSSSSLAAAANGTAAAAGSAGAGSKLAKKGVGAKPGVGAARRKPRRPMYSDSEESDSPSEEEAEEEEEDDAEWVKNVTSGKLSKADKLGVVDHSKMNYPPFRKSFYTETAELSRMNEDEVAGLRKELDGIKVRGVNIPKPIKTWSQAGLNSKVLDLLKKSGCESPLPIQAQALPVIMSGRDCIGIAKTGSGKTLAFVLPLLRHAKDQAPLQQGDGPIGLIMAPTRELVQQISKEVKKFAKLLGMECTAVFGGSGVANQISELKRGSEVVVCTPGRMIDLLATSNGKITNLRRVTYLVMDEADRMFDMGFEPQIMRIVNNIRPDRQTVMFSATFPRTVETLARKVLDNPVEINVGGRSVVNKDITQIIEIRPESDRFLRLLEVLGEWYEKGKIIIFVQSQEKCDTLFRDLLKSGYPCLSLHGGKDQSDRECTISDFKGAVCNILVATSVAARGLDVASLVLVVNYDVPNHHEDYVHRVGRTGRAGNKGTAITFIGPDEEKYAPDLVKALKESGAPVPQDLSDMADSFNAKRKAGLVAGHGSGYGGSGFKFNVEEQDKVKQARKAAAKEMGLEQDEGSDTSDDEIRKVDGPSAGTAAAAAAAAAGAAAAAAAAGGLPSGALLPSSDPAQQQAAAAAAIAQAAAQAASILAAKAAAAGLPTPVLPAGLPPPASTPASGPSLPGQPPAPAAPALPSILGQSALPAAQPPAVPTPPAAPAAPVNPAILAAQQAAAKLAAAYGMPPPGGAPPAPGTAGAVAVRPAAPPAATSVQDAVARAAALAAQFGTRAGAAAAAANPALLPGAPAEGGDKQHYEAELEINEFPQHARWKVMHRDTVNMIAETTGAALFTKGVYVLPGKQPPPGERKIYLLIEGPTENSVKRAKQELKRLLEETTEKVMRRDAPAGPGRYSVM